MEQGFLMFRLSMILLNSLELIFLMLNVELHGLIFILSILRCWSFELTVAKIGSLFYKFKWECSIATIFKLDTVFAKKFLTLKQISSSLYMTLSLFNKINVFP